MGPAVRDDERATLLRAPRPRVRHCWVQHAGGEWPGVVVQWRHEGGQWSALVSWVEDAESLRVEWLPAQRLRRA
ncbi:hypothetical protein DT076_11475 [Desertihabitans brevis]|uniref:Uncharacterized protein n=1 Tax=Desertihabitans brevis TaxID=2268447 RepID=A0A367YUB5_9ACTN|nr:hypothetical protein [Desertihabitans brevis]RCK69485.1 hypothetical protein DT076_11475 [Desertihabitans brevis]